jgi:hypothetical protein
MTISIQESALDAFRTSNPAGISRELMTVERMKYDKKTGRLIWRETSFILETNQDTRALPKSYLSSSFAIAHSFTGPEDQLAILIDKIVLATNHSNSVILFAPTKSATKSQAAADPVMNRILQKKIQSRFNKQLESPFKATIPCFVHVAPTFPYFSCMTEMIDE